MVAMEKEFLWKIGASTTMCKGPYMWSLKYIHNSTATENTYKMTFLMAEVTKWYTSTYVLRVQYKPAWPMPLEGRNATTSSCGFRNTWEYKSVYM